MFFPTVPSANTLVRWVNENAFASILQARPCPTFGRPVHLRGSPHRLRPGSSPHALRIPSRDGHPALRRILLRPTTHYRRLWIAPLIRVPEGLQPSRTTRCSAHTTPAADFCGKIRVNCFTLSRESATCRRSPEISSTAFCAQPPNLRFASLIEMGFAIMGPLARRSRL